MAVDLSSLMPQQRVIATTLDRPLFVSAGAGSGKTFTLTRRILWALDPASGPYVEHLDRVLAITFTKDAAAEIRERVRAAFIEAGMDEEALYVDDAWISTIHGMCSRILRAHALELGIDPEFSVIDETAAQELMEQAIDHVLARAEADAGAGDGRAKSYGRLSSWYRLRSEPSPSGGTSSPNIRDYVKKLLELSCALPNGMGDVHLLRGHVDFSGLRDACQGFLADFPKSKSCAKAQVTLDALDAFEAGEPTAERLTALLMSCAFPAASGKARDSVILMKAEAADAFVNAYLACDTSALDQLMELAKSVEAEYRELKRRHAVMDNDDLLRRTRQAFQDHASIRAAFEGRFKLVMIDEFQDTDQQQVDLIGYLAGEGGRALCTVGDAQQSIYRFRGAEVEVFRRQQAAVAGSDGNGDPGAASGTLVQLVKNFRSHEDILAYVAQVFDGRDGRGGLMPDFLNLEPDDGRDDGLVAVGASRRQALFVAGGTGDERTAVKASAIARRFRALSDAGQPVGGMALLLGAMTRSEVYARAFREEGLDCVIAGGSVFADAPEVQAVRVLVFALANPLDAANGLAPLLASPMFALGVQEFLALATSYNPQTGETRRRNIEVGIMTDDDAPGFGPLPLLERARTVLRSALSRVGRDSLATIARDVVNGSGWFVRLEARGPEGKAVAANVLKALDAIGEAEAEVGRSPRRIALSFDDFLAGKQAPGALNEQGGNAVRIMTVHASKGLEFPVVAVSECFSVKAAGGCLQTRRTPAGVEVAALPDQFDAVRLPDGSIATSDAVRKKFNGLYSRGGGWLTPELAEDVSASDSVAARFIEMREDETFLDLEERARLLYVAMTRARDVLILAMDAKIGSKDKAPVVAFDGSTDLTGKVLERILPERTDLDSDHLVFDGSQPGDFELIALGDFSYEGEFYSKTVNDDEDDAAKSAETADTVGEELSPASSPLDTFTLVYPAEVSFRVAPASRPPRDSYSYSSVAAALRVPGEDHEESPVGGLPAGSAAVDAVNALMLPSEPVPGSSAEPSPIAPEVSDVVEAVADGADSGDGDARAVWDASVGVFASDKPTVCGDAVTLTRDDTGAPVSVSPAVDGSAAALAGVDPAVSVSLDADGDPTALGSAFHAAAQWMVEMGADAVPPARLDALCRTWGCTPAQRKRLETALTRWRDSSVRVEALAWPCVRAEVSFFAPASADLTAYGAYAEGAIDLLCTDPADMSRALVVDYKTGGSPDETPDQLQAKHELQARIYADALHKTGYARVTCRFVRVEQPDPADSTQPQVVSYEL